MLSESLPPAIQDELDKLALVVSIVKDWRLPGDPTGPRKQTPRDFPIGAAIKAAREHVKMSQNDLQAKTGMTHQYVSKIENGHSEPSFTTVKRFADALGVPLWKLARHAERMADGEAS